jgi:hypothetical protein
MILVDKTLRITRLSDIKEPEWIEDTGDYRPIISRGPNHGSLNPPLTTNPERRWFKEHEEGLKKAMETGKCPSCGEPFDPNFNTTLYDHGYRFGIECGYCR